MGFYGDLLKILAHTGLQTAGQIGAGALNKSWAEQAQEKLLGLKMAAEGTAALTDPMQQQEALGQLQSRLNLPTVTERGMAPVGESATLANLGQRPNLTYPTEGPVPYEPSTVKRIVAPPLDPKIVLGNLAAKQYSGLSPERILDLQHPRERTVEASLINRSATLAELAAQREADRLGRKETAQLHADTQRQNEANRSVDRQTLYGILGDKYKTGAEQKYIDQMRSLNKDITDHLSVTTPKWDAITAIANEYNAIHGTAVEKFPHLANELPKLNITSPKDWTMFPPSRGVPGKVNYEKTPTGGTPKSTGATPVTPSTLTFPRVVKAGGQKITVNSQEEYDELKTRYSK